MSSDAEEDPRLPEQAEASKPELDAQAKTDEPSSCDTETVTQVRPSIPFPYLITKIYCLEGCIHLCVKMFISDH